MANRGRGRGPRPRAEEEYGDWGNGSWNQFPPHPYPPPPQHQQFFGQPPPPPYGFYPNPVPQPHPPFFGQFHGPRPRGGGRQSGGRGRAMAGRQQTRAEPDLRRAEPDQTSGNNQRDAMEVEKGEVISEIKDKNQDVVCYNCGEAGHFSTACGKARCCFICRREDHVVEKCPEWKKNTAVAQFYGSVVQGLGFYHIDVEPKGNRFSHWKGLDNFGILTIEQGDVSEDELVGHLRKLFDDKWDWKLRPTEEYIYITRFPPHKRVESLVIGKMSLFPLDGTDAVASLKPWNGDVEPISTLQEVWVQMKGIPPKWADWWAIREVASSIGPLLELDWTELFASYFSMARVKIKCKDPFKIPFERVFEFGGDCFIVYFKTEGFHQLGDPEDKDGGGEELEKEDDGKSDKKDKENGGAEEDEEDLDEVDLLDDCDGGKEKGSDAAKDKGSRDKGQSSTQKGKQVQRGSGSGSQKGKQSVKRSLNFLEEIEDIGGDHYQCADLLRAMELVDSAEEETDSIKDLMGEEEDEIEMFGLPKDWIDNLTATGSEKGLDGMLIDSLGREKKELETASEDLESGICTQPDSELREMLEPQKKLTTRNKKNKNQGWGPVMAQRKSQRFVDDGRTMMEKAQGHKKEYNLDGGQEIRVDEYGYTLTPDSQDSTQLGDSLSCGKEGKFAGDCCNNQVGSFSSFVAGMDLTEDFRWKNWKKQDLVQGMLS